MLHHDRREPRGFLKTLLYVLILAGLAVGLFAWFKATHIPGSVVLEADFTQPLAEYVPADNVVRFFLARRQTVRDVVEAIEQASRDKRIKGLVANISESGMKLAQVQEIRDAVIAFRLTGKPAIAYAETFGETGPGNASYYLATAFDSVYLQPSGDIGLTGLIREQPFVRGALDKLGVIPRIDSRKEYKGFRYLFTDKRYTADLRKADTAVLESQFSQIVNGIAAARKLDAREVRTLIDGGPFLGKEAVEAKLVDDLLYRDEVYAKLKSRIGAKTEFLGLADYGKRRGGPHEKGTGVALIYGVGGIERGESGFNPLLGEEIMGSATVAKAFRDAVEDREIKAILFRINSPGGSYVASDSVWREVMNAKKAGKPVIVSMSSVAASGGYFAAMGADKIVAQPATVTGSIGVLGGKMVTTGLWNKLGVAWDEVHTSKNADAWTGTKDLTPVQRERMAAWLDRVYDDFVAKAASGRKRTKEELETIARGRIWSGEDAKRLGLVDELGGFPVALTMVRRACNIADDAPLRLVEYPKRKSVFAMLFHGGAAAARGIDADVSYFTRTMEELRPSLLLLRDLGSASPAPVLRVGEYD